MRRKTIDLVICIMILVSLTSSVLSIHKILFSDINHYGGSMIRLQIGADTNTEDLKQRIDSIANPNAVKITLSKEQDIVTLTLNKTDLNLIDSIVNKVTNDSQSSIKLVGITRISKLDNTKVFYLLYCAFILGIFVVLFLIIRFSIQLKKSKPYNHITY